MASGEVAFVPLEAFVRSPREQPQAIPAVALAPAPQELAQVLHDVRRFRAALSDVVEAMREDLSCDLASAVLARELALAPPDLARIAQTALATLWNEEPLALNAHPDDVAKLRELSIPVRADASLRRGDLTIALRYGSIDMTLGARLAHVLESRR